MTSTAAVHSVTADIVLNKAVSAAPPGGPSDDATPFAFHRSLPGYRPTPLIESPSLARRLGVGRVLVKQEGGRLGLPSFKILGASWAIARSLYALDDAALPADCDLAALRASLGKRRPTLVTATDGNHGHAVAWMARLLDLPAHIVTAAPTAKSRVEAIRRLGVRVTEWPGSYDEAVQHTAGMAAEDPDALLISDTSWPGYETVPGWVIAGYSTMFHELDAQLTEQAAHPDLISVPVGVGSFATAVVRHWRPADHRPHILAVEPTDAACLQASLLAGRPVRVPGPHRSVMAGLDCGRLSHIAWPDLRTGIDVAVRVGDALADDAVRALAATGIEAGESGAASLAGLLALDDALGGAERATIGFGPHATVLLLNTEGTTARRTGHH
ncbi:diaminopropionate ammonia-lyase [Spirillospora sp. NPDC049652]